MSQRTILGMPLEKKLTVLIGTESYRCNVFASSDGRIADVRPYARVVHTIHETYEELLLNEITKYMNGKESKELRERLREEGRGLLNIQEWKDIGPRLKSGRRPLDLYTVHFYYELTEAEIAEVMGRPEFKKAVEAWKNEEFRKEKERADREEEEKGRAFHIWKK